MYFLLLLILLFWNQSSAEIAILRQHIAHTKPDIETHDMWHFAQPNLAHRSHMSAGVCCGMRGSHEAQ